MLSTITVEQNNEQNDKIVLVHLHVSYKENRAQNYKYYENINSAMNDILDKSTCTLEVLNKTRRKIYLDVEHIPFNETNLIYTLISDFTTFINIENENYVLTMNTSSTQHSGLSYHVIFPYTIQIYDLKKLVQMFTNKFTQYTQYIDDTIYNILRLFRLPENGKVTGTGIDNNDSHKILKGEFINSFIQDITNIPPLFVESINQWNEYKYKYIKSRNRSNSYNFDEISDIFMTEFRKLSNTLSEIKDNQLKLQQMNTMLVNRIIELEKNSK